MKEVAERAKSLLFEPGDTLSQRVVRGLFVVASPGLTPACPGQGTGSYFNMLLGLLANLVLTRLLAPEAFGVFSRSTVS